MHQLLFALVLGSLVASAELPTYLPKSFRMGVKTFLLTEQHKTYDEYFDAVLNLMSDPTPFLDSGENISQTASRSHWGELFQILQLSDPTLQRLFKIKFKERFQIEFTIHMCTRCLTEPLESFQLGSCDVNLVTQAGCLGACGHSPVTVDRLYFSGRDVAKSLAGRDPKTMSQKEFVDILLQPLLAREIGSI